MKFATTPRLYVPELNSAYTCTRTKTINRYEDYDKKVFEKNLSFNDSPIGFRQLYPVQLNSLNPHRHHNLRDPRMYDIAFS